jgi:hypothetical protein
VKPPIRPGTPGRPGPADTTRPTGVTLDKTSLYLFAGGSPVTLKALVTPEGAVNKSVTWSSSNPQVAAVDATGNVTPAGPGTCRVLATTQEGGYNATCEVMVDIANTIGNTPGNVANGGYVAHQGNWVYYANPYDGMKLYKAMLHGQNKTKLSDDKAFGINVVGEWIYYVNDSQLRRLFKVRIDGTGRAVVNNKDPIEWTVSVVNQRAYYDTLQTMYSIGVNGLDRTKLNDETGVRVILANDWLYYQVAGPTPDDPWKGLCRIHVNGTGRTRLSGYRPAVWVVDGEWLYMLVSGEIVKMKTNGQDSSMLVPREIRGLNARDNWVYYWKDHVLRKIRSDGKLDQALAPVYRDGSSVDLFLAGNWVYCYPGKRVESKWVREVLFKVRTDGTGFEMLK